MTSQQKATLTRLENAMSQVAGFAIELTIRGTNQFTASSEGKADFARLVEWLKNCSYTVACNADYDEECDLSCLYFSAN